MTTAATDTILLGNGVPMPVIGYGTWPIPDREAESLVAAAIDAGYRLVDTAEMYANEQGVGRGVRASGIDRSEIFLTTKLSQRWHGYDLAQQAFAQSAKRLGVDYIDLFLIHWPNPDLNRYPEAWGGLVKLLEEEKVRAIGVSNFKPAHLQRIIDETGVTPHVNQIQLNPLVPRRDERRLHAELGIVTESWAPIGKGGRLLGEPVIADLAGELGRTPAQVVIRWHLQQGLIPIPKSSSPARIVENIHVFDFELDEAQMAQLDALDDGGRSEVDSDLRGL